MKVFLTCVSIGHFAHFAVSFQTIFCPWSFWFLSNLRTLLIFDAEAGESKKVTVVNSSVSGGRVSSGSNIFSVLLSYLKWNPSKKRQSVWQNVYQPGSASTGDKAIVFIDLSSRRPGLLYNLVKHRSLLYCQEFMALAFTDSWKVLASEHDAFGRSWMRNLL